jgi:hypothetical protein
VRVWLLSTLTLDGRWGLDDHFVAISATVVFRDTINICRDRYLGVIHHIRARLRVMSRGDTAHVTHNLWGD